MDRVRRLLALSLTLFSSGCSTVDVINALVPSSGYRVISDLPYADGARHGLDVYVPTPVPKSAPVIVFIYGGNWQTGSKKDYLFVGQALTSRGFVVVIPDYRLYPTIRFPDFLEDNARAMRWARDHARDYGGDPNKLFLIGHSAGAYNAAMLSIDPRWLTAVGMDPAKDIRATIGLAGPYDFLPLHDPALKIMFGPEKDLPQTQPINFVTGKEPPMLLVAGTADTTVEPSNVIRLGARIRASGGEVVEKFYPGVKHEELVGAFAAPLRFIAPLLADVTAYIKGKLPGA